MPENKEQITVEKHEHKWINDGRYYALVGAVKVGTKINLNQTLNVPVEVQVCDICKEVKLFAAKKKILDG